MAQGGLPTGTVEAIFKIVDQASPAVFDAAQKIGTYLQKVERSMQNGAASTRQFNAALDQFSGKNVAQKAYAYASAIERIGGVSALTAREQETVNRVVTDAIEKFRVLGRDAPEALTKLAAATKQAGPPAQQAAGWWSKFGDQVKATALGFLSAQAAVGAVRALVTNTLEYASSVADMAQRTGIGAEALQRLQFAAQQSGAEFEPLVKAINAMQESLAGTSLHGKGAAQAFEMLGLSLSQVQSLKSEEAFSVILDKLNAITDANQRTAAAMAIFGPRFAGAVLQLDDGFRRVAAGASVMSAQTIGALDQLGDRMNKVGNSARAGLGSALVWLAEWGEYLFNKLIEGVMRLAAVMNTALAMMFEKMAAASSYVPGFSKLTGALRRQAAGYRATADEAKSWADAASRAAADVGNVEPPTRRSAAAVANLADHLHHATQAVTQKSEALRKFYESIKPIPGAFQAYIFLADAMSDRTERLRNLWRGLAEDGTLISTALRDQHGPLRETTQWLIDLAPAIQGNVTGFRDGAQAARGFGDALRSLFSGDFKSLFGDLKGFFTGGLSKIGTGFLESIGSGIMGAISNLLGKGLAALGGFFKRIFGGKSQNRILDENATKDLQAYGQEWVKTAGGIERARDRAMAFGYDLDGILNNKGRKGFENVKTDLGDIDAKWEHLQTAMDKYGIRIDQLGPKFKQLSQDDWASQIVADFNVLIEAGTDLKVTTTAMKDEINQFVQRSLRMGTEIPESMRPLIEQMIGMKLLTDENGDLIASLEGSGIQFAQTMTQAMDQVTDAIDRLPEAIARALRAIPASIPIDVPVTVRTVSGDDDEVPGFAGGTKGRYVNFGSGTLAMLHGYEKITPKGQGGGDGVAAQPIIVQTFLDGRQIAEATVPHVPSVVKRYGLR